jgi:hypothetical protein
MAHEPRGEEHLRSPGAYGGVTLQLEVASLGAGRAFYTALFGREPDFAPHDDFLEWRVVGGAEVWWQVVVAAGAVRPLRTRTRLQVDDVRTAAGWARDHLHVDAGPVSTLPGVVSWVDFEDPWGNRLGYYEDLAPSGAQPEPGGSVHDRSHFRTDPA